MLHPGAVTLKQLRALIAVAELRSLTAAAGALNQTTPTIHSQIRNLEIAIGVPLLTRSGESGFRPTAEGAEMLRAARRIEAILSQAGAQIRAMSAGRRGRVTLGVVSTAKYFAPRLVRQLQDRCPEIEVALKVGDRESVIVDLDHFAIDLALMGRPPRQPEVRSVPLGPNPHGIVVPPGHRMAGRDGFDPSELVQETFLARGAGSGTRILMNRFLDRLAEGQPVRMIEMDSNETIKQAVLAGLGVAFLSLHTVEEELRTGRLVLLRGLGLPVMRQWYLVWPLASAPSAAAERIAAEIDAMGGSYLPRVGVTP